MNERRNLPALAGIVLAFSLIAACLSAALTAKWLQCAQFRTLSAVCEGIVKAQPDAELALLGALRGARVSASDFLSGYGYRAADFFQPERARVFGCAAVGFAVAAALLALSCALERRRRTDRIQSLADYLEAVHLGRSGALIEKREDEFSRLQDEIYKAVSALRQTRDDALAAKRSFAANLSNIAHQLKTPVTSASLALQEARSRYSPESLARIGGALERLTRLEEALLLLARVDAGVLPLTMAEVDVFTALTLAADGLDEIARARRATIDIPELGATGIRADLAWTVEALSNLLKNCVEHAPAGSAIHCRWEQNPLYTYIEIWDEGPGFAARDIPHLFERFYRGERAAPGGIGIGLPLAKKILALENATLWADNHPNGGARFEIRFYRGSASAA